MSESQLYTAEGERLYLDESEREAFFQSSVDAHSHQARTLCRCLYYTGCRISEALELEAQRVDFTAQALTFRTLKKRGGKIHWRSVPVPASFLDELDLVHDLRRDKTQRGKRLWPVSRVQGWRIVRAVLDKAGLDVAKPNASPKGLRHSFAVAAVLKGVPLSTLQKWMGHASMDSTAVYLQVIGAEERSLAARMWE